jgi:tetratricopeptide (TPR) repeat protein
LREIAISLIERHYPSVYQKIYEDRLYDNYTRSRINVDPEFYISRVLLEKFKSEQNMTREDLINWWRASGKAIYFEELRRTLNKFVTKNYWTCQIEIDALLSFFKVELKYVQEVTEPIEPLKTRAEETAKLALPVKKDPPVIPKPFRSLDTGEAYQPTRLIFEIVDIIKLITTLNNLKCCSKTSSTCWNLYWRDELDDTQFQSVDDYQRPNEPIILAKISINATDLQLNTLSIKRLALLAPFFYEVFCNQEALVRKAYYYTLLFCYTDEIPSNLWPQISLNEADEAFGHREKSNSEIEKKIKNAASKEESDEILGDYVESESAKNPLPIEVYRFKDFTFCPSNPTKDEGKAKFLGFYIYVRAREELAIKKWIEPTKSHTLSDVAHRVKDQFLDQGDNERQRLLLKLLEETRALEQEVDQDSANVVSWQQLGCLYQEQGNLERSLQCFQTVLTLLPQNSLAFQQLALVYAQQKNYEDAEGNYRDSLALESNFGNHFDLAILLYKQEKYEVALDHFLRALLHDNGGSWVLKQKNEEDFLKQLFGQAFHTHKPLIKDKQFVLYLGLVLCFNKMQALHLRDFYILRLVSLVTEHKGEAFYRDILEDFTKLIDFKNDVISVQHWFLIDDEESSSRETDRYSWSRLKRLVSYYPSSVSYHILAKISGLLKKIEEHDEFLAIAMSLEGEQKATDPKYQQPSTIAKLLASSIARALQESKIDRPLKEQRLLDSTYHYQAEDIRNLLAVVGSKQAINVLGVQYIVAELKQDKEKLAVNFKIEMDKALRNDNPSIMALSLSKSDDVNQHWIGMLIKPEAGNPLKPTIYIIDSLGSGFELDFDISRKTLFDLIAYKSKSPQLWEGIVVIMGFLNGFEKLRPTINVTGLKQQSDVNDTGPCTVQNLLDMAGGKKLQSYSKHAVKNLRTVHAKMLTEKVAPSLTC